MAVPRKLLEVASHFRETPQNTACQMATDESDEGSRLEMKSNSIFGPSFPFECIKEHKLGLILLLSHKFPIVLYSFKKVLERWNQVKCTLSQSPRGPRALPLTESSLFSFTSSYS